MKHLQHHWASYSKYWLPDCKMNTFLNQWHLRVIILNELLLVTELDERGKCGEIKESYLPVSILKASIMSPLILLYLRVGR